MILQYPLQMDLTTEIPCQFGLGPEELSWTQTSKQIFLKILVTYKSNMAEIEIFKDKIFYHEPRSTEGQQC